MLRSRGSLKASLLVLSLCALASCGGKGTNTSSSGISQSSKSSSSSSKSSSSSSKSSSSSVNSSLGCAVTDEIPQSPLRRLTRTEYENSVRDLLGVNTAAVKDIPLDVTQGFDNNAALQGAAELLVEKYVLVSETLAAEAVKNVSTLTGCNASTTGERACAQQFARKFGRKAFRRPITTNDESFLMSAYDIGASGGSYAEGIEVMIRAALQSPNFIYRLELTPPTQPNQKWIPLGPYELATRLSFFLWGTGPDDALLDAAAAGQLNTKAQVAAKAREMLKSPKAQAALTNFIEQWTGLKKLDNLSRNSEYFPNFSADMRDAMQRELPAFVNYMFTNNNVTLRNLFTSNVAFVSGPLASVYGVSAPSGSATTPKMVTLPASQERAGLLTQAGFMAVQAHPDQTSPVLRGKFVRANLLCTPPPPPPDDVDITVPDVTEAPTARDRANLHLSAGGGCASCHVLMDPIGLAFENFDALGQHRIYENGNTIDVSGEIMYGNDPALTGAFKGVKPMAEKLVNSQNVQNCVATQMFRFSAGRYESQGDTCSLYAMQTAFSQSNGNILELMIAITQTEVFLNRTQGAQP
jgi:hypothetical protein